MKLYETLGNAIRIVSDENAKDEIVAAWAQFILAIEKEILPSGSGFDAGTEIDLNRCTPEKLVFVFSFHHMNENGYYTGWTDHVVTVTPSFNGVNIRISGRNKNQIKDYIHDTFYNLIDVATFLCISQFIKKAD